MNPRLSSHRGHPNQLITSGPRPLLCGVRRDLMRGTSEKCTLPAIRLCQPTPLTAPRQRLHPAHPRSNACAISTAQDYHPKVWSHSISGIGSASTPALCNSRSCPALSCAATRTPASHCSDFWRGTLRLPVTAYFRPRLTPTFSRG